MSISLAFIGQLAEERIKRAQEEGQFDGLPGSGKPINLDDDAHVPEELRMAWRVLKNAGCLPPELEAEREIHTARELLEAMTDEHERYRQMQRLNLLVTKRNMSRRRPILLEAEQAYYEKIVARMPLPGKAPAPEPDDPARIP